MRDAEHLRTEARELYDSAKRARNADDGFLCVLRAMELESEADDAEQHAADVRVVNRGQLRAA